MSITIESFLTHFMFGHGENGLGFLLLLDDMLLINTFGVNTQGCHDTSLAVQQIYMAIHQILTDLFWAVYCVNFCYCGVIIILYTILPVKFWWAIYCFFRVG